MGWEPVFETTQVPASILTTALEWNGRTHSGGVDFRGKCFGLFSKIKLPSLVLIVASSLVTCGSNPQPFWHQDQFCERQFFQEPGWGDGFRMIQERYNLLCLHWSDRRRSSDGYVRGTGCKYRQSFTCSPDTQLLLCGTVPNRPRTSTGPWPWGWEPLVYPTKSFPQLPTSEIMLD